MTSKPIFCTKLHQLSDWTWSCKTWAIVANSTVSFSYPTHFCSGHTQFILCHFNRIKGRWPKSHLLDKSLWYHLSQMLFHRFSHSSINKLFKDIQWLCGEIKGLTSDFLLSLQIRSQEGPIGFSLCYQMVSYRISRVRGKRVSS